MEHSPITGEYPPGRRLNDRYWAAVHAIDALDRRYKANKRVGWLYILRNPAFRKPLLKIGKTRRPPTLRAAEIGNATGVPQEFEVVYFVHVSCIDHSERWVHEQLAQHRVANNREFFEVPLCKAVQTLDQAGSGWPVYAASIARSAILPQVFGFDIVTCRDCGTRNRVRELNIPTRSSCSTCGGEVNR